MILQRLCEAAEQFDFPPPGYQSTSVKWIVELDTKGRCLGFIRTVSAEGKKNDPGKRMHIPATATPPSGIAALPQLLAGKAEYALGVYGNDASARDRARAARNHEAFVGLLQECYDATKWSRLGTVLTALRENACDAKLPEGILPGDVVTFSVGEELLVDAPIVRSYWANAVAATKADKSAGNAVCLVCGQEGPVANPHPKKIKGVPRGQKAGCTIVAINASAFDSYGHKQRLTQSPVCWNCAQTYADVLQALLDDPSHSFHIQDRLAYVFWTRQKTEFSASRMLMEPDPADVRHLLETPFRPAADAVDEPGDFCALAISGSGGRVVIRDWFEATLDSAKQNLARYFNAQAISSGNPDEDRPIGLYALIAGLIPSKGKNPWGELPPDTIAHVVNAALRGTPLPETLLYRAVSRARVEHRDSNNPRADVMTRPRAAVIKMCLLLSTHREEGFDVMPELNTQTQDPAYLCGRLLAVLENIQDAAIPGAKATLVDRYYGTASSAPASVFGGLMRLAQSHLGKLRKEMPGAHTRLQQAMEDVAGAIGAEFPRTLTLIEQGKFGLGYYQQRAAHHAAAREAAAAKRAAKAAGQTTDNDAQEGDSDV